MTIYKISLLIAIIFLIPIINQAQQTYIPDDNFEKALINLGFDSEPLNDSIPTENIDTVKYLNIFSRQINDLTGIENFKELILLQCGSNNISELNLSNNPNLEQLYCHSNNLTELDVSKNPELSTIQCFDNKITSLDLFSNSNLQTVSCYFNDLISLKLPESTDLELLYCQNNQITTLDVSKNPNLLRVFCNENRLNSLDVTANSVLESLDCRKNPDLICIQVNDSSLAAQEKLWLKDPTAHYSEDCSETNVEFPELRNDISIFPNPARNNFLLSFEFAEPQSISISLNDLSGKTMIERNIYDVLLVYETFEVSKLTSGVYFLSIESRGSSVTRKVLVE
jgi:hypothetical protein